MNKSKKRSGWELWLGLIIITLIIANVVAYYYLFPKEGPVKPIKEPFPSESLPLQPRISIVIDDIGYTLAPLKQLLGLGEQVTYAVIPHLPNSNESARMIREVGGELILHLPMEPHRFDNRFSGKQPGMLKTEMTEEELISQLEINFIPGIVGVNNHMGSKFTEDREKMVLTLNWIKQRGLFFLDSVTSAKSVGWEVAGELGIKRARRNIFLDNDNTIPAIENVCNQMVDIARQRGDVIVIGHLRKNTIEVLARFLPELPGKGIQLVPLSRLVD